MNRRISGFVRVAVVLLIIAALVAFARTVQWQEAWRAMRSTSLGLLAVASLVNLLSMVAKGMRWWIFLRPIDVPSLWLAVRGTFVGAGLNNVLVANGGDVARVVFVSRVADVHSARVLATLALERLFEIVGYVILFALAVSLLELPPSLDRTRPFAFILLALSMALVIYLLRHPERVELPPLKGEGLLHRARAYGRSFFQALTGMSTRGRFAGAVSCSLLVWALQVATYHLTARAAHLNISLVGTIAALLIVNTGFAVRATPGNVGVFQVLYAVTAVAFGLDKDQATGVALLIQLQQMLPVTLLGIIAAPEMLFDRRRILRPDTVLPGEPAPERRPGDGHDALARRVSRTASR